MISMFVSIVAFDRVYLSPLTANAHQYSECFVLAHVERPYSERSTRGHCSAIQQRICHLAHAWSARKGCTTSSTILLAQILEVRFIIELYVCQEIQTFLYFTDKPHAFKNYRVGNNRSSFFIKANH